MGQILGLGYSSGDKTKASTKQDIPPELRQLYGQITDVAGSNIPAFKGLLSAGVTGDRSAVAPYASPLAGAYTPVAGTATKLAPSYQQVASAYQRAVPAAIAPYYAQLAQAQEMLRRRAPMGGGQTAALAQLLQGAGVNIGAAQSAVAQKDVEALNALKQRDIEALNALAQKDIETENALRAYDVQQRNALAQGDIKAQNEMMQKLLSAYGSIFGAFNPAAAIGSRQETTTSGNIGIPFANLRAG